MATDLQLYRSEYSYTSPDMPEIQARALLNRARAWLNCFCNDLSIATQLGKPPSLVFTSTTAGGANPIPFELKTWWRCSRFNLDQDFYLCANASLLEIISDFNDVSFSRGETNGMLHPDEIQGFVNRITAVEREWLDLFRQSFQKRHDLAIQWRDNTWPFLVAYAKLVVLSIGLRDTMELGTKENNPFREPCVEAAIGILTQVLDRMDPLDCVRYFPENYFIITGFAAAFLLNILHPKLSFLVKGRRQEIISVLQGLITLLGLSQELKVAYQAVSGLARSSGRA
ncbi:hypothetical protein M422DRAFT_267701 [Sphaerobolus stellatus SS14]|uniref:Unplaced genomic scaffold SPHSTscaffold_180, whole genome shotgun sequence n=1 Tax=Sphaerobolus stellatus (strain SS14) TaxID=990650 RepID=A0A0C9UZZ8_SPHS4|nr:hypothetical protein M422DRAFT_267701 [Sphaerobolus stellatus SS14]